MLLDFLHQPVLPNGLVTAVFLCSVGVHVTHNKKLKNKSESVWSDLTQPDKTGHDEGS